MMEEKKYPIIEEEDSYDVMAAAEPAVAYAVNHQETLSQDERILFEYPKDYDPGIGPYSIKEMNERIDRAERDGNNPDKWVRVDDFWAAMQKEHVWLQ